MNAPLRSDFGTNSNTVRADEYRSFTRTLAAHALCHIQGDGSEKSREQIARTAWPMDTRAAALTKAAVPPTDTVSGAAVTRTRVNPLLLIAPPSAAARLFDRCMQLNLEGIYQYSVPHAVSHPFPLFVPEGGVIPFVQPSTGSATLGPARKLGFGIGITRELEESTPESASAVLARLLGESAAKALDTYVFDNVAADTTRPAGLLNGVVALSASTTGGQSSIEAIANDIAAFAGAFNAANINSESMILVCNPIEAWTLRFVRGFERMPLPVLMSPAIVPGTVIAVIPEAIASGYDGLPEIESSKQASVHFATPALPIVDNAGVPAAPTHSLLQQEMIGIKCKVRCAWASLQPGAVQYMTGCKW